MFGRLKVAALFDKHDMSPCVARLATDSAAARPRPRGPANNKHDGNVPPKGLPQIEHENNEGALDKGHYDVVSTAVEDNGGLLEQFRNGHIPPTQKSLVTRGIPRDAGAIQRANARAARRP